MSDTGGMTRCLTEGKQQFVPFQPHDMWEGTVRPSVVEDSYLPTPGGFPEVERAHHHLSLHCNVIGE